jgi:hypothetical protein
MEYICFMVGLEIRRVGELNLKIEMFYFEET